MSESPTGSTKVRAHPVCAALVRWFVVASLALTTNALALDPDKAISQYVHNVWQTDEGLPELVVENILEAADGYLWVGTQEGLARFDGLHFTVYDHINTPALRTDFIHALAEDRHGNLWIGTDHGVVVRNHDGSFASLATNQALAATRIRSIVEASDGAMWIGGLGGLNEVREGQVLRAITDTNGLASNQVSAVLTDTDGSLWVGSDAGIDHLDAASSTRFTTAQGLPANAIRRLRRTRNGMLLALTTTAGFARLADGRFAPWKNDALPENLNVRDVCTDRDGNLWIGTDRSGLVRVHSGIVSRVGTIDGLVTDQIRSLYEDRQGNLWVGTNGGGLSRFRDGAFSTFAREEGLSSNTTYSVFQDRQGSMWVATLAGLNRIEGADVSAIATGQDSVDNHVSALGEDARHNLWIGTAGPAISRVAEGKVVETIKLPDSVATSSINAIFTDRGGSFWLGTNGNGLLRYADGEFQLLNTSKGLSDNFITSIAEDAAGTLWVGTAHGVNSLRDGKIQVYTQNNGFPGDEVASIHLDSQGSLWMGTLGEGLLRLQSGQFTQFTSAQGLPDDTINSVLEDDRQNLWIGSNKGVFRVSLHELDDVANHHAQRVHADLFGRSDGMESNETTSGDQPSAWRARDGRLWFATVHGVSVVDPDRISKGLRVLPTYIEGFSADEKVIDWRGAVRLPPATNRIEIRYTAPDLSDANSTRFRYRLDGVDEHWIDAGRDRVAHYTNVPSGAHSFEVQASTGDGIWSEEGARIGFFREPFFYQTWWFRIACVMCIALVLGVLHFVRVAWLRVNSAVANERQRIAGEIHDSLAQGFSGISLQIEAALGRMERAPNLAVSHLQLARDLSRSSLNEARRSVWNLQSPEPSEVSLLDALCTACQQLASGTQARLQVHTQGAAWAVSPLAENNLLRIAQEAVGNAIHHGTTQNIDIQLRYAFHQLTLIIEDDGGGFDIDSVSHAPGRGFGLGSMRQRSAAMRGNFGLERTPAGTRITVRIPRPSLLRKFWRDLGALRARRAGNE